MVPAARVSVVCLILAQSLTAAELTEPASDKKARLTFLLWAISGEVLDLDGEESW